MAAVIQAVRAEADGIFRIVGSWQGNADTAVIHGCRTCFYAADSQIVGCGNLINRLAVCTLAFGNDYVFTCNDFCFRRPGRLIGCIKLAAVDSIGAACCHHARGYTGDFVAARINAACAYIDVTRLKSVLSQRNVSTNGYAAVVEDGITCFHTLYVQIFVQADLDTICIGFGDDVAIAVYGDGIPQFFDACRSRAVGIEGQAFVVNSVFGCHTFGNIGFGRIG